MSDETVAAEASYVQVYVRSHRQLGEKCVSVAASSPLSAGVYHNLARLVFPIKKARLRNKLKARIAVNPLVFYYFILRFANAVTNFQRDTQIQIFNYPSANPQLLIGWVPILCQ